MPKRADNNQPSIVADLRAIGATVTLLHTLGRGCPDAICGYRGHTTLMEFKTEDGELTPDQREWIEAWRGESVAVVRNSAEAFHAIGAEVEGSGTIR